MKIAGISPLKFHQLTIYLVFLMAVFIQGCMKDPVSPNTSKFESQLVVWKKPASSIEEFNAWLVAISAKGPVDTFACKSCDNSLMLLKGRGVEIYLEGRVARGGRVADEAAPGTGDDGPVLTSRNFDVYFMDTVLKWPPVLDTIKPVTGFKQKSGMKVAVFDSGLERDPTYNPFLYRSTGLSCFTGAETGFNFFNNTGDYNDDHIGRHGTNVTRLILDQVLAYKNNPVEILPVKTHNIHGHSDLFNILCGFAYAKERGVQIINASFGFYQPRLELMGYAVDSNVLLLGQYVKHILTKNNILLIAAAGNKDVEHERNAFRRYGLESTTVNFRDLETVSFYPASLARDPEFYNVITATTVRNNITGSVISPNQNFSSNVVDIGVKADSILGDGTYVFINSANSFQTLEGSSFAAPVVTGKICANYYLYEDLFRPGGVATRELILSRLMSNHLINENAALSGRIRANREMAK